MDGHSNARPPQWTHERTHFFKYVTYDTAYAILRTRSLRWSSPLLFNDPFDGQFNLHIEVDRATVRGRVVDALYEAHYGSGPYTPKNELGVLISAVKGIFPKLTREEFAEEYGSALEETFSSIDRTLPSAQKQMLDELSRGKILCLSEINDNLLMWSHYADQHRGAVIKFECIADCDSPWGVAKPVRYSRLMPRLMDDDRFVSFLSGQWTISGEANLENLVYTKALDWQYEREWRIFAGDGRAPERLYEHWKFAAQQLGAIYLGCRMPVEHRTQLSSLIAYAYPHAKIYQASKADMEFALRFEELC